MDSERIRDTAKAYLSRKEFLAQVEEQVKQFRDMLMELVQTHGDVDDSGNTWLPAEDVLVKRERRRSVKFNPEQAQRWLEKRGFWDEAKVTVPEEIIPEHDMIDEDALAAFIYKKQREGVAIEIPDEAYDIRDTYALKVTEEDHYDY